MINVVLIDANTEPDALKKEMRKKLMTGGAVVRLKDGVNSEQCIELFRRFRVGATQYNIHGDVLRQIAQAENLPREARDELKMLGFL